MTALTEDQKNEMLEKILTAIAEVASGAARLEIETTEVDRTFAPGGGGAGGAGNYGGGGGNAPGQVVSGSYHQSMPKTVVKTTTFRIVR